MPKSNNQIDTDEYDVYNEIKNNRGRHSGKRFRRLRAFERNYYKKTCEVTKTGHGLDPVHHLNDGDLAYSMRNVTYSLNKKKRWLLPDIIEERIREYDRSEIKSGDKKGDQMSSIDERLKIIMYENENTRHRSNCIRYGNSQTEPQIIYKNGRRFNSNTLTKWMDFDTNRRWSRRHRNNETERVNQPNFGFQQRAGFFPSEVTYHFLYPKQLSSSESHRNAKLSFVWSTDDNGFSYREGRHHKDTNKHRRKLHLNQCLDYLNEEQENEQKEEYSFDEILDENQQWSIAFEDTEDSVEFPIEYFFPVHTSICKLSDTDEIIDLKANKFYEPPSISSLETSVKSTVFNESFLCSFTCENEHDFLHSMQQSDLYICQANISPAVFTQSTQTSSFITIYSYSRVSHQIEVKLKFIDKHPFISFKQNQTTCSELIKQIAEKLKQDEQIKKENQLDKDWRLDVDALRGSLPVSISLSKEMLLVQPNSTDKQTALQKENLIQTNDQFDDNQWFDTQQNQNQTFDCSICCELLTYETVYELLPCHHILCYACLTSYIRTNVSSINTSPITCFQSNCSTELNIPFIQTFVSYEIYHSYSESSLERRLFSSGRYRKCPSRICSNLLIIENQNKSSLMCSCGQRVCAFCLEEYHFPATCKQYKSYEKRLRQTNDHLLSSSGIGENTSYYIAQGKNCPTCGEFVEKNGGCPHMTCKCGYEYCWSCLKRWAVHDSSQCFPIAESIHELRSSTRSRFFNKAITHRRQRNQHEFDLIGSSIMNSKLSSQYNIILSTYIDLNTLAEFIYVFMQKRHLNSNIRSVLGQTAHRLEADAFRIKLRLESNQLTTDHVQQIRVRLRRTAINLIYMKENKLLL